MPAGYTAIRQKENKVVVFSLSLFARVLSLDAYFNPDTQKVGFGCAVTTI